MENKNMNNTSYTSRTERKQFEEELKNKQLEKEKELEAKRQEIKNILFDDDKKNIYKNPRKREKTVANQIENNEKRKKPRAANIVLSLTYVISIILFLYLIIDSTNQINQIYQIINAFLLLIIVTCFLISFKKSFFKNKSAPTVITSIVVLGTIAFNGLYMTDVISLPTQSYLPNFESENLTKAINWTEENNIKTDQNFEYSDTTQKYSVISQSEKAETLTKNLNTVDFVVSNGPDYNKEVILADMTGWNVDDVLDFVEENFLNNVTINFEENDSVDKETIIRQSTTGTIKRSDSIIFTASLGNKEDLSPIKLEDLTSKSLLRASVYLGRNGIQYELKYEFSDEIEKGHVISSDPKKGTTVNPDEMVTLTISKGKEIKVPNLKNKTMAYVTKWMVENNLQINYSDRYDTEIESGRVIESNYKEGDIIEEGTTVDVTFSKGPLKMKKFDNINDFKSWADTNGIKYEIKEEFNSDVEKDKIIKTSIEEGKTINLDDTITVYVSRGEAVKVPDFSGNTKSEAQKACDNSGLSCSFTEEYSSSITSGKVIRQSVAAGTEIAKDDKITITIATSNRNTSSSSSKNNSSSSSSSSSNTSRPSGGNNSSSGGSSGGSTNTCDRNKTVTVVKQSSLNGDSAQATLRNYQNAYPGIKFTYTERASQKGSPGMIHQDMPNSFTANYCDTYTLIIIK